MSGTPQSGAQAAEPARVAIGDATASPAVSRLNSGVIGPLMRIAAPCAAQKSSAQGQGADSPPRRASR